MAGNERLAEESARAVCQMNRDCDRYSLCQLANGCRCQAWGKCELVRIVGQPCHSDYQCALGLVCQETSPSDMNNRCTPNTRLDDMPRFADLPETDMDTSPEIKPTYVGPLLVAVISCTLVLSCLVLVCWYRITAPTPQDCRNIEMASPRSGLVHTNQPPALPSYSTVHRPHHPVLPPREYQRH